MVFGVLYVLVSLVLIDVVNDVGWPDWALTIIYTIGAIGAAVIIVRLGTKAPDDE